MIPLIVGEFTGTLVLWQREHMIITTKHLPGRDPLPDKGKPAVRRGRKATDQISDLAAGLPEEE